MEEIGKQLAEQGLAGLVILALLYGLRELWTKYTGSQESRLEDLRNNAEARSQETQRYHESLSLMRASLDAAVSVLREERHNG